MHSSENRRLYETTHGVRVQPGRASVVEASRRATFEVDATVCLLESVMTDAGVEFWYHVLAADAIVEDRRVRGAIVESKAGREAVLAKVVVDCTGDGDMAAWAGAPYGLGRLVDGLMQPMTLMFAIDGLGE